jgi:hypothetical protein
MRSHRFIVVLASVLLVAGLGACASTAAVSAPRHPGPDSREIRFGQTVAGELRSSSPRLNDGSHYQHWHFRGRAGQRVDITMRSDEFDAFLGLESLGGGEPLRLQSDDDGAGGTDSRIVFALPAEGLYRIVANSLHDGEVGRYRLTLAEASPDSRLTYAAMAARAARFPQIRMGQSVSGRFDGASPTLEDNSPVAGYTFRGSAGETVEIELRSSDFDAYLYLGLAGEQEPLATNDDGPHGTDSLIRLRLPRTGTYVVLANALLGAAEGAYTLTLSRATN